MKKLRISVFLISLLTLSFCAGKKHASLSQTYKITGTLKGVDDGTWVYLTSIDRFNKIPLLDSTLVKKGCFEFKGQLKDKVLMTMLGLKGPVYEADGVTVKQIRLTDATLLWLENNAITLEAERGNLYKAKIAGSLTQKDFELEQKGWEDAKAIAFIQQYPNTSYYGVYRLNMNKESWGKEDTAGLYNLLSEDRKNTICGKQVAEFIGTTINQSSD